MFTQFFYNLRDSGIPVTPTAFLTFHRALERGLILSIDDFYITARSILVKSERYFDLYDRMFAYTFKGAELMKENPDDVDAFIRSMVMEWLKDPKGLANAMGVDESKINAMTPDELVQYFLDRLKDQKGRHDGGSRWIGTGGTSPVGHSGYHPGGMRVGGESHHKSAMKVALERRFKDYSLEGPLTKPMVKEALKRLRHLIPVGPKDTVNIDKTLYQTMKNGGEIEIVFDQSLKDRIKVILAIDNGGWSMDPYIALVQTLFLHVRSQFKDLKILYFHNTIYETLYEDPTRYKKPVPLSTLESKDSETRLIIIGDASMAPYELMAKNGSIDFNGSNTSPSITCLNRLYKKFPFSVWLNPMKKNHWDYVHTIRVISDIFPMFELSIDGLEQSVEYLMGKKV